jgi:uncharacterized protein YndB with AHSA1/START domain
VASFSIDCSITIQAPAQAVWDLIQTPARRTEWDARLTACTQQTSESLGKGARLRNAYRILGIPSWMELEFVSWQPPFRSGVRTVAVNRGSLVDSVGGSWRLDQHADGSTTWRTRIQVSVRGGILAPLVIRLFNGMFQRMTEQSLHNVKRIVEAEQRATSPALRTRGVSLPGRHDLLESGGRV